MKQLENLRQLHVIRGLSALYVAIGHAKVVFWIGGSDYLKVNPRSEWSLFDYFNFVLDMTSSSAQEFVIVFFVLSGFFMSYSFNKNGWSLKDFFLNRLLRIYPPYIFSIILSVLVFVFISHYNDYLFSGNIDHAINERIVRSFNEFNLETLTLSLFFLKNNDYLACNFSYWSLLPELLFYMLVPFVVGKRIPFLAVSFLMFIVGVLFNKLLVFDIGIFFFEYMFYFAIGLSLFPVLKREELERYFPSRVVSYCILLFFLLLTIFLGLLDVKPISNLVAAVFSVVSILVLLRYPLNNKLFFRIGTFLGDISYTLYLCHLPIYYLCYAILTKETKQYVYDSHIYWCFVPIALISSYFFYRLIEKPSIVWVKKVKAKV